MLSVRVRRDCGEVASHVIHALGSTGLVEEETDDPRWVCLKAYFAPSPGDGDGLRSRARERFALYPALGATSLSVCEVDEGNWADGWKQHFKPFEIAPGFIVAPSWEAIPEAAEATRLITLDPGMAFGTGLHETTRLCARAILQAKSATNGRRISLLDVGTGSGILSILGKMLGIERVVAVDNDPVSLSVAHENFMRNGCGEIETVRDISLVSGTFDIVVANILLSTLIELRERISALVALGASAILSGITHDQEDEIANAYAGPLALADTFRMGDWSAMVFRKEL